MDTNQKKLAKSLREHLIALSDPNTPEKNYSDILTILADVECTEAVLLYTGPERQAVSSAGLNALHLAAKAAVCDNTSDQKALKILKAMLQSQHCTCKVHEYKTRSSANPLNTIISMAAVSGNKNPVIKAMLASEGCTVDVIRQGTASQLSVADYIFDNNETDMLKMLLDSKFGLESFIHNEGHSFIQKALTLNRFDCLNILIGSSHLNPILYIETIKPLLKQENDLDHPNQLTITLDALFNKLLSNIQLSRLSVEQRMSFSEAATEAYSKANVEDKVAILTAVAATERLVHKKVTSNFDEEMAHYRKMILNFSNSHRSWAKPLAQTMAAIFFGIVAAAALTVLVASAGMTVPFQLPFTLALGEAGIFTSLAAMLYSGVASNLFTQFSARNIRNNELVNNMEKLTHVGERLSV